MQEIIETYEELTLVETILHSNDYIKFIINECTIQSLESKTNFIMKCHYNIWKPLCIIYHQGIGIYDKIYYLDKKEGL